MNKFGKKKRPFGPSGGAGGGFNRNAPGPRGPRLAGKDRSFSDRPGGPPKFGGKRREDDREFDRGERPFKPSRPFREHGGGHASQSDRPAWKPREDRTRYGGGEASDWKARSGGAAPGMKRDFSPGGPHPSSGPGDARPNWKKDRPAFSSGPGTRPRKSYQQSQGGKPSYYGGKPSYGARPSYGEKPQRDFSRPGGNQGWGGKSTDHPPFERPHRGGYDRFEPRKGGYERRESRSFDKREDSHNREFNDRSDHRPASFTKPDFAKSTEPKTAPPPPVGRKKFAPGTLLKKGDHHSTKTMVIAPEAGKELHLQPVWVYESMVSALPDGDPAAGDTVYVHDHNGRFLGSAVYNPDSRIRARMFSLRRIRFDETYIREALRGAIERRRSLGLLKESCRLVFGESDGLPGLIADKYGACLVIQPVTAAVDRHLQFIIDRLNEYSAPDGIVVRRDATLRTREGLETTAPEILGDLPAQLSVRENNTVTLIANVLGSQSAAVSLDQRLNRRVLKPYCTAETRVLSLYSHVGEWALRAASYGAGEVIGVDSSQSATELAIAGAAASGLSDRVSFVEDDAFEYLRGIEPGRLFDIIICDPPAFAKMRQHREDAARVYKSLNYLAMVRLKPGGILVTCSSSHVFSTEDLDLALLGAANEAGMKFQVIERRGAAPDHPVLPGFPESDYLKCFVMQRVE